MLISSQDLIKEPIPVQQRFPGDSENQVPLETSDHPHPLTSHIPEVSPAWRVWGSIPQWFQFIRIVMAPKNLETTQLTFYDILLKLTCLKTLMKLFRDKFLKFFSCIWPVTYDYYLIYHINHSQIASQLYQKKSSSTKLDVSLLCSKLRVKARVQAHIKLLSRPLTQHQLHRPSGCFLSISDTPLPQGLCTDCSLLPGLLSPPEIFMNDSLTSFQSFIQMLASQ